MVVDGFFQLLFMNREPDDEVCYDSRDDDDDDDDVDTFFRLGLDLLLHFLPPKSYRSSSQPLLVNFL